MGLDLIPVQPASENSMFAFRALDINLQRLEINIVCLLVYFVSEAWGVAPRVQRPNVNTVSEGKIRESLEQRLIYYFH